MSSPDKALKRLKISILAGAEQDTFNLTPAPVQLEFIFGIETELTPMELAISNMQLGESTSVRLTSDELKPFLGSQYAQFSQKTTFHLIPPILFLQLTLQESAETSPKDVVKAMAQSIGHGGCGGACGCGCG